MDSKKLHIDIESYDRTPSETREQLEFYMRAMRKVMSPRAERAIADGVAQHAAMVSEIDERYLSGHFHYGGQPNKVDPVVTGTGRLSYGDTHFGDGTFADWKTSADYDETGVLVVMGGDYLGTERRLLAHMVTAEQFAEFQAKFNEAVDTFRPSELKRESLRDAVLVKAGGYTVDRPRRDKRDWEKRNKKQRRR